MVEGKKGGQPTGDKDYRTEKRPSVAASIPQNHGAAAPHCEKRRSKYKIASEVVTPLSATVAAIAAIIAAHYYAGQLIQMRKQTVIQRNASMLAESAWPYVSSGNMHYSSEANGMASIFTTVRITNAGKTPARQLYAEVAMRIVPNGETCVPDYRGNQLDNAIANVLVPGGKPISFIVKLGSDAGQEQEPKLLSKTRVAQWKAGQYYIVTYGRITYRDIFGGWHWEHFCSWSPSDRISTSAWCEAYNDMDTRRLGGQPRNVPPASEPYVAGGRIHSPPLEPASVPFCKRTANAVNGLFVPHPPEETQSIRER